MKILSTVYHLSTAAILFGAFSCFASQSVQAQIFYVTDSNGLVNTYGASGGSPTTYSSGYSYPTGIAVDSANDVFVADPSNGNIYEIPSGGGPGTLFASTGAGADVLSFYDGNLYAGINNAVLKYDSSGVATTYAPGLYSTFGMAFNQSGVLFGEMYASGSIYSVPTGGGAPTFFSSSNINNPAGMAFDSNGDLFVANGGFSGSGSIVEFASVGGVLSTTSTIFTTNVNNPIGLAIDSQNNIYVTSAGGSNEIYEFTPAGVRSNFASSESGGQYIAIAASTPEPSTWALLALSAIALGTLRLRRRA